MVMCELRSYGRQMRGINVDKAHVDCTFRYCDRRPFPGLSSSKHGTDLRLLP